MIEKIKKELSKIIDPHTGIDIVTMDLVKDIKDNNGKVLVKFQPTSPFCPLTHMFNEEIKNKVKKIKGVKSVDVEMIL
jgi:metal-sulfur cluster biosynthetic enzyme